MTRALAATLLAVLCAVPASAQSRRFMAPADDAPMISLRPFVDVRAEAFTATETFDAIFGETVAPFWGGGLQVVAWRGRIYGEVGASRILKENGELVGERAFVNNGEVHRLGIPLRSRIKPLEVTGGYRFNVSRRLVPYVGAGVGRYQYTEESDFAVASENVDVTHSGFVFQAGAEVRLHRWIGVAFDGRYAHVPGILGTGGVSQELAGGSGATARTSPSERDLGGWSAGVKLAVGR
jgi:outer membrane protein W